MAFLQSRPATAAVMLLSAVSFGVILKDGGRDGWHWLGLAAFAAVALMLCYRLLSNRGATNA